MKFFIIGASGLVGFNCLTVLNKPSNEIVGTHLNFPTNHTVYFNAINLSDSENFNIKGFQPDVIVHCGALTNVDYCEDNIEESYEKTVLSTINVVNLCKQFNSKLIYISTDYVFNGQDGPYTENTDPAPINIYGQHKLEAENIVRDKLLDYLILRITNVYGNEIRNKNFIARIVQNIKSDQHIDMVIPADQYATPVNASDIARAIDCLVSGNKKGIYHLGSTDYYNRYQLFMKILDYFPDFKNYKCKAISTSELKQAAKRPLLGGLISAKLLNEHPEFSFTNVDQFLKILSN